LYQVLETSDVPAGVVNIVTGARDELAKVLAEHADVDALWYFGSAEGSAMVERLSVNNLKRTWVSNGKRMDLTQLTTQSQAEMLRQATQVKNVWVPFGA
jgi:aldehyde dehydrogenase (NAD+)